MIVDCDCDAGCRDYPQPDGSAFYGICPACEGRGWYPDDSFGDRAEAWLLAWAN
jgi:streptogramin lyase